MGGTAFFAADDGETGQELWRTDGTPAGTFKLRGKISLTPPFSSPFVQAGPHLFFGAFDHDTGTELWALDGP